ncbi:hypothetical protein SADUNF_Sadunf05G0111600 [Salix dunnii]|uniref:Uncharacterized protein n=1 Tax=Salix dunnii TaxID=1413687 RepID=A0A835K4Q2_9ROSI|nr:hypothetical protein SADUNF_Sadunf05G0111600 [Salix dunnii]
MGGNMVVANFGRNRKHDKHHLVITKRKDDMAATTSSKLVGRSTSSAGVSPSTMACKSVTTDSGRNVGPLRDSNRNLHFSPPSSLDGRVTGAFHIDVFEEGCEHWQSTITGHFIGQKLLFWVNSVANRIWGSRGLSETTNRLSYVASAIGVPFHADIITSWCKRQNYMMICVEIKARQPLVKEYDLRGSNDTCMIILAYYKWIQCRCCQCQAFRHSTTMSPINKTGPTMKGESDKQNDTISLFCIIASIKPSFDVI